MTDSTGPNPLAAPPGQSTPEYTQAFIARQPVFDSSGAIWGHELLFRHSLSAEHAVIEDAFQASLQVAMGSYVSPQWERKGQTRIMVNFTPRTIREQVPRILPPGLSVVKVEEALLAEPGLIPLLVSLKAEGHLLAVDGLGGLIPAETLLPLADILVLDMPGKTWETLTASMAPFRDQGPLFLAKRVEDHQALRLAKECGVTLFQGFFFQKPETFANKVLSSSQASRLSLVRLMEAPEPDFKKLAEAIGHDVSISFRLLAFLNSPFFGLAHKVESIRQALLLAGWTQMKTWLRLVVMADMTQGDKPSELAFLSAQRGRFLESAARLTRKPGATPERMFLFGLFSLLESIFEMPMAAIVAELPLDGEVKDTLCGRPTTLSPWLDLACCFERADWAGLSERFTLLGLDPVDTAACYAESMQWAHSFFSYLR